MRQRTPGDKMAGSDVFAEGRAMEYFLYGIVILLLLGVIALLAALYQRARRGGRAGEIAEELRARLDQEQEARVRAETRLEVERKSVQEQKRFLEEAEAKLKDAFAALSADALGKSSRQFLSQAAERLSPIQDLLKTYQNRLNEIEKARNDAYGGLKTHLETLARAQDVLQKEAHQLSTALRSPTARGRWGELTLRRVVEVAGMSPYCDFDEQASTETEQGRLRPDMTVNLPNDRIMLVDSKVPLDAYMQAVEAGDDGARQAGLASHAKAVRARMTELGQKAYASHVGKAPDFVVLFLPLESSFSAALEQDRELIEDGMKNGVVLATPTTLIALLKAVHYGWRQQEMAENAERIGQTGRELFKRMCKFLEYFAKVGDGLSRAAEAYDAAYRSYESRLAPSARKLAEQAAAGDTALPEVQSASHPTRLITNGGEIDDTEAEVREEPEG